MPIPVAGPRYVLFASYNYLGLISHPKVREAAKKAIDEYGTGAAGAYFIGTTKAHEELERKIAHEETTMLILKNATYGNYHCSER